MEHQRADATAYDLILGVCIVSKATGLEVPIGALLPASLGQKTMALSFPVTLASDDPLTAALRSEDQASADGDKGWVMLAKRLATPANSSGTDGDYESLTMSGGYLWVAPSGIYSATLPSLSDTNRNSFQLGIKGTLLSSMLDSATGNPITSAIPTVAGGLTFGGKRGLDTNAVGYVSNGTTLDPVRKPASTSRLLSAAATTNGTSVKASAGDLFRLEGYSARATQCFLKLYNKASAPTVGTDTPVLTIAIPPTAKFDFVFSNPLYFGTGIAYAITTAAADADTGALTAADITCFNTLYT